MLNKIDHKIFIVKALPVLYEKFFHIIPAEFWKTPTDTQDMTSLVSGETTGSGVHNLCVRCDITCRVRKNTMIDLLFECSFISFEHYDECFSGAGANQSVAETWDSVFKHLVNAGRENIGPFHRKLEKLLKDSSLVVPENLQEIIEGGFPCTCPTPSQTNRTDEGQLPNACETESPWKYYEDKNCKSVSTNSSLYPDSEQDLDSCSSAVSTFRSDRQSPAMMARYVTAELMQNVNQRDQTSAKVPAGTASRTRNFRTWPGKTVLSILDEAFEIVNRPQRSDRHTDVPDGATCGPDAASNTDITVRGFPGKVASEQTVTPARDVGIQTDSLYKTFRVKHYRRRRKRSPLIRHEEFLQKLAASPAHPDDQEESLCAEEELTYPLSNFHLGTLTEDNAVDPIFKFDAETQGEKELRRTWFQSSDHIQEIDSDPLSSDNTSSTGCSSSEASLSPDDVLIGETTVLEDLCDFMGTFSSEEALTEHLRAAEKYAEKCSGAVTARKVTSCQRLKSSLQSTFARFEEIRDQLALSSQEDCNSRRCLSYLCESVRESCFSLVLGLQACLLWDTSLAVLGTTPSQSGQTQIADCARQALKEAVAGILKTIKDIEKELQQATPGTLPDGYSNELARLETLLSNIDFI